MRGAARRLRALALGGNGLGVLTLVASGACSPASSVVLPGTPGTPTPPDTATTIGVPVEVDLGDVVTCADPLARQAQVFDRLWLVDPNHGVPKDPVPSSVVVDDLTGDGLLDVFVPQRNAPAWFFVGDGLGGFVPTDPLLRVTTVPQGPVLRAGLDSQYYGMGAGTVDLEGDGDRDVFVYQSFGEPQVLRNDGLGQLVPKPFRPEGVSLPSCGGAVGFADFDLDGDLDLAFGRTRDLDGRPCGSMLFEQVGGDFSDRSDLLEPAAQDVITVVSAFLPLDDDPEPELFLGNIKPGLPNRIVDLGGSEWPFEPGSSPLDQVISTMGLGIADLNDDGRVDLFIPGTDEFKLMISEGDGWVDQALALGLWPDGGRDQHVAWAGDFADLDADGRLDLVVTFDPVNLRPEPTQPDAIYHQVADLEWVDVAPEWGWDDLEPSRSVVAIDLDGNGFLDLVKRTESYVAVDLARCNANGWLTVRLLQEGTANRDAIGAEVVVWSDGVAHRRWITAGATSFAVGRPQDVYIGLGDTPRVDRIDIVWPDQEVSAVGPLDGGRVVTVRRLY